MSAIIQPGAGILFMKVGTHAQEGLEDIINRKSKEIEQAGFAMWGYGGNTCHPRSMVQPFAEIFEAKGQPIHLVMQEMNSKHFAEQVRASDYSEDGLTWKEIPKPINVLGSRFALVIKSLERKEVMLPLNQTRVPVGPSMGRLGSRYLRGQVDKACLEVMDHSENTNEDDPKEVQINLVAELQAPYAVFLKNTD
ncbi:hypothetical protein [Rhodoblastus sp.]|jgi:hypothetical protein|uniref:hypothetical protein n=1 Tax=Rhodoblastus sp. TaxID=1962975 RepID=UPI0025D0979F|nr:hypothetical protein [Rhodoblastus sp.]